MTSNRATHYLERQVGGTKHKNYSGLHDKPEMKDKAMRKFWMFVAVGVFSFGILTSHAFAKDLDKLDRLDRVDRLEKIDKMAKMDRLEVFEKDFGMHIGLPAEVSGGRYWQMRYPKSRYGLRTNHPDSSLKHFAHTHGVGHG
jgi:hypothetical protein